MPKGVYKRPLKLCSKKGCNKKHYCKGLCRKCYYKQYYRNNKESFKQYHQDNRERDLKYIKKYDQDHEEQDKQYYQDNKERFKQYRQDNKEQVAKQIKLWDQSPKGKASSKADRHNRRTLLKDLTVKTIQRVYEDNIKKYGVLTCYLCEKPIIEGDNRLRDSLDHSTPITRGGGNNYENLGIAHFSCNSKKGTKTLEEWNALKINP